MADEILIRASSLSSYPDCMRRAAARSFRQEIEDAGYSLRPLQPGIGAATGSACHAGAAHMLRAKLAGEPAPADAGDAAVAVLASEISQGVLWDDTSPNRNTAEQQVLRQVEVYRRQVAVKVFPLAVETRLEARIEAVVVSGQVDAAVPRGLRDLKTGTRRRPNGFQYGLYALIHTAHGHAVDFIIEDFVPRAPLPRPQPPAEAHYYDVAEAERAAIAIVRRMAADLTEFRETADPWAFMPNPMSVLCSDRYCPAWGTAFCHAHKDAQA